MTSLPSCPLCGAPALAGYAYTRWDDIGHDCGCVELAAYSAALPALWRTKNALPAYLETVPELYRGYTAATITKTPENAPVMAALKAGLTGNLYLYGPAGTGKTHLAVAGARRFAESGKSVRFWGMAALMQALRSAATGETPRPALSHWDVLVLDDIDKIKPSAFAYEAIYGLIEERWANKKITIYTAQNNPNRASVILTPEGDEVAADALASRMSSGLEFKVDGKDWRAG